MTELERLRLELERLHGEAQRLRVALAQRPRRRESPATMEGVAARDLLAAIADALAALGQEFFVQYDTTTRDLLTIVALCEDDAARAGPLIDLETRCFGNTVRALIVDIVTPPYTRQPAELPRESAFPP